MARYKAPRSSSIYGMKDTPHHGNNGTWLEPEALCYPSGGMYRRCRARVYGTDTYRVIRCGISDTFFSIKARQGFITSEDKDVSGEYFADGFEYVFHPDTSLAQIPGFKISG